MRNKKFPCCGLILADVEICYWLEVLASVSRVFFFCLNYFFVSW